MCSLPTFSLGKVIQLDDFRKGNAPTADFLERIAIPLNPENLPETIRRLRKLTDAMKDGL